MNLNTATLPNGLRIVHHGDDSTSHVAVNVLYNVGARDEDPECTGLAHLFEHLMFGGSANVKNYDYELELAGGSSNAWTSNDFTNFYDIVSAENVETAFWTQSDRMLSPTLSQQSLDVQRDVVIEEFKQTCLNKPYGDIGHLLRGLIYKTHPYRFPTIGREIAHIERVDIDTVRQFFFSHYAPNNAVLAVAGNITFERVMELAEKWFGDIPRRDIAPRQYAPEAEITEARRLEVKADVPVTRIYMAFPMQPYTHPDYKVADIITDILSSGRSARFMQNLVVDTPWFTRADASVSGSVEAGFLLVTADLINNEEETIVQAEKAIWKELDDITTGIINPLEMRRVLNRFETNRMFSLLSSQTQAQEMARCMMVGEDINAVTAAYRSVTPADIGRVGSEIFQPSRSCTVIYKQLG